MDFLDELKELGVDVDKALKSLVGKAALYEKLVKKFPGTAKEYYVSPDFGDSETDDAIEKTHALKGVVEAIFQLHHFIMVIQILCSY